MRRYWCIIQHLIRGWLQPPNDVIFASESARDQFLFSYLFWCSYYFWLSSIRGWNLETILGHLLTQCLFSCGWEGIYILMILRTSHLVLVYLLLFGCCWLPLWGNRFCTKALGCNVRQWWLATCWNYRQIPKWRYFCGFLRLLFLSYHVVLY